METIRLGQITSPVGIKGELRVYPFTDQKEQFEQFSYVLLEGESYPIETVRYMKGMVILKLQGITDRTQAEGFRGKDISLFRKDAPPLPEDTYYVKDLIGLRVIDEDEKEIGKLVNVIINTAQDLYEIRANGKENTFLVPAVEEFIRHIDLDKGVVRVHLIEGMMEE